MPAITTHLATAGASLLLVLASFSAGSAWSTPQQVADAALPAASPKPTPVAGVDRSKDNARINAEVTPQGFNTFPELDYVPITQCRLADTRKTSKLGNGTTRGFYAADKPKIKAQGGNPNGCGIPASAAAVTFTVLVYQPSTAGRPRVWKAGTTVPDGNAVYYAKANTTSQLTIGTRTTGGSSFGIKNTGSSTHLIIEATGYYVPPLSTRISPTGAVIDNSGRLLNAVRSDTGFYILTWDRDIDFCTCVGSSDVEAYTVAVWTTGNMAYVYVYNAAGTPANYYANVLINC